MEILIIKFKILTDFTVLNINASFKVFFLIYRLFAVVVKYYSVKQFMLSTTTMLSTCINRLVKLVNNNITPLYHPPKLATDGTGCSVFAVRFFFFFCLQCVCKQDYSNIYEYRIGSEENFIVLQRIEMEVELFKECSNL